MASTFTLARMHSGARTNVPRWSVAPPPLDTDARSMVLVGYGSEGQTVAAGWQQQLDASGIATERVDRPFTAANDPAFYAGLASSIAARQRVGDRIALAGPEIDVLSLRAGLLNLGYIRDELICHATSSSVVRVRCAHCRRFMVGHARPGDRLWCSSCGFDLIVYHHVSPLHAAYLGFRADAENHD